MCEGHPGCLSPRQSGDCEPKSRAPTRDPATLASATQHPQTSGATGRARMGGAPGLAGTSKAKLYLPEAVLHRACPRTLVVNYLPFSDFNTLFIKPKTFKGKVNV